MARASAGIQSVRAHENAVGSPSDVVCTTKKKETTMSATVQKAIEAVEHADGKVPPSAEVTAQEQASGGKNTKAAAKKASTKKSATPKYDAALKATAKRAETLRGKARTV